MTVAAAKGWIDGQLLPIYHPTAGASVTPDASYTDADLVIQGAFTPPTGNTHTTQRVQVTSPAVSALTPDQPQYVGGVVGTVSGCTAGAVGSPVKDPLHAVLADTIFYDGKATSTANAALSTIAGPGTPYFSPYNWRNASGVMIADCPGAYVKGRFSKTSLSLACDVSYLVSVSALAGDYPWVAWSIDGGALQRAQLTNTGTIVLATGLANATHTFVLYYEQHTVTQDTWGAQFYTLRLAATPFTGDSGFVLQGPATLFPRVVLFYGASIEYGYASDTVAPQQRATSAWTRLAGAAMQAEYGVVASSGQGWINQLGPGYGPFGVPPILHSWDLHFDTSSRLASGLLSPAPDVVVLTYGTNDQPFNPVDGSGYTDAAVEGSITYLLPRLRGAAGATTPIVVSVDMKGNRKVALAAGVAAHVNANADAHTFYVDPGYNTVDRLAQSGAMTDGVHPTTATSVIVEPLMRHAVLAAAGFNSAYSLELYQHTDTYQGRGSVPIDETGQWHFSALNITGEWRLRVIKNSDGSQQGAEWTPGTNGFLSSGIILAKYKYADSYYLIQSPAQTLEPQYTDVLIDPAGTLTLGHFAFDSLGYPGEWRLRPLNPTTFVQSAPEWQGVNGNHDTYDNLELRFCLVTDRDYMVNRQLASTSGRFYWSHTQGRRAVRLALITDDEGAITTMPAPQAEWTMTTGLPRSTVLTIADAGYLTRSEDLAFTYDVGLVICVYLAYNDWATSLRICLALCAVQFADGPFPFAVFQRYTNSTWDRYIRMGGGVAHPAYALALHMKLAPKAYQDPRINAAVLKAAAYMDLKTDATGLVQGGEGIQRDQWLASHVYPTVGFRVQNFGSTYELITAGISAASGGPTGTASNITDNTAHWKFIIASVVDPVAVTYHATEHNIGCWRFRNLLYEVLGRRADQVAAARIKDAMLSRHWNDVGGYFWQSTDVTGAPDGVTTLDSGSWGGILLADWGELAKATRAVNRLDAVPPGYVVTYAGHTGYRTYSGDDGILKTGGAEYSGLWPEGTFGVAFAYYKIGNSVKGDSVRDQMLLNQNGSGGFKYLMTADAPDIPETYEDMAGAAWCVLCQHRDVMWAEQVALPNAVRTFERVEVWNDLQANGGVILGILTDVLDMAIAWSVGEEQTCSVTYPRDGNNAALLTVDNVLVTRYDDGSCFEWPIHSTSPTTNQAGDGTARVVVATGHDPRTDLAEFGLLREVSSEGIVSYEFGDVNLTPEEYVASRILPSSPDFVVLGQVTVSAPLTLDFSRASPASAMDQIIAALQNIRIPAEWNYRRVSNFAYAIDVVTAIGEGADVLELRVGIHILTENETQDGTERTTAVIAFGKDGATMAHAAFKITNIAGTVLTLVDVDGIAPPILVNDQLNNLYVVHPVTGALVDVTDSAGPDPSTITVASATGFVVGQRIEFRADTDRTQIQELTLPGVKRKFGSVVDDTLTDGTNYIPNAFQSDWSGGDTGPADGWTFDITALIGFAFPPTIDREVGPPFPDWGGVNIAHIQSVSVFGPIQNAFGTVLYNCGYFPPATVWLDGGLGTRYTLRVRIYPVRFHGLTLYSGNSRPSQIIVQLEDPTIVDDIARTKNPVAWIQSELTFAELGQWVDLNITNIELPHSGIYNVHIFETIRPSSWDDPTVINDVFTIIGQLEFYVGAVQITPTADVVPYFDGSHAAKIWHLANYQLARAGEATVQYRCTVLDWSKLDANRAELAPTLGGICRVVDEDAGTSRLMRLVAYTENPMTNAVLGVTLSTQRNPLTVVLARAIAAVSSSV